jgi:intraflagellar transport protein 122
MIGGSNKSVVLYTKDGVKLGNVGDQDSWIWCCAARPGNLFGIVIILGKGNARFFLENLK